ncbi:MAG: 8-amino-7-oxononanoate synthase [Pseudomonadota bacterium]
MLQPSTTLLPRIEVPAHVNSFRSGLAKRLQERKDEHLYRTRRVLMSAQAPVVMTGDQTCVSFCSNDYLGLATHPEVVAAFKNGLDLYGAGSGGSHLVTGHNTAHHALEEELAAFTGRSRALVFSSGYMANVGVISCLVGKQDYVFEDRLNHASLLDGGLFSGARFNRYPHGDMNRLSALLKNSSGDHLRLIVSDGVFSMDGDVAPLANLLDLAEQHDALVMIDDAHGFGTLGSQGGGLAEAVREQGHVVDENRLPILIGTFGKAFGTAGAFVAGSDELIETLIQFCRPYIYTTAMPPAVAEATRCSLRLIQNDSWRREHLQKLIMMFRKKCSELGLALTDSITPVQGLLLGSADTALQISRQLESRGLLVTAIRPPTVPQGTARLRITFSATHTIEQLQRLLDALEELAPDIRAGRERP